MKKENKIIKNYNTLTRVGLFVFFFFTLFSFSNKAFALPVEHKTCGDISGTYCYANAGHTQVIGTTEYWAYRGVYPDTSSEATHQTGSFNFSSIDMSLYTTASTSVWWRFSNVNSGGTDWVYSFVSTNGTIYSVQNSNLYIPDIATSTSFANASSTGFLSFLNVPELLKTRLPFAYFFQGVDTVENLQNSATSTIPIGSFDWYLPSYGTTTIDLFSTTTVQHFLPPTSLGILRGLMVTITYFSTIWFLFHDAKNKKHLLT